MAETSPSAEFQFLSIVPKDEVQPNEPTFSIFGNVTEEQADAIHEAADTIDDFRSGDLAPFARQARSRYESVRNSWLETVKSGRMADGKAMAFDLNFALLTAMTMFRLYLDQTDNKVCDKYGKNSSLSRTFREKTSEEYDGHFAYRFFYRLRNYGQHRNLPTRGAGFSSGLTDPADTSSRYYTFNFAFDIGELLKERDVWGAAVTKELETMGDRLPVDPVVEEAFDCIDRISRTARLLIHPEIWQCISLMEELEGEFAGRPGSPHITRVSVDDDGKMQLQPRPLPIREARELRADLM